jgi:uncharacterized cupin superfamily protein
VTSPRTSLADERLVSRDVHAETVDPDGASAALATALLDLASYDATAFSGAVGLWEAGPGTDTDTEADEIFLVLSGAGTVTFDADGSAIDLRPGVLVRLHAGDRTTWTIIERLRKLWLA